ncbi:MAG: polyhydroxyalkanoate synthesis repressor PhaR [Saprospiraceae bacterium]|nr:polyhydroxyalkanoate synthesis repressor PhaR [Saprospiraceae bacterium]
MSSSKSNPIVVKKYANRRLYDTDTSTYITLEDMCERIKSGKDFVVVDAKSGQDLTRQVLTQIILEREIAGSQLLPVEFLRSVIRFYDDKMQNVLQQYLNASMQAFVNNQDQVRSQMRGSMGKAASTASSNNASPFSQFEEMTKNNVALFEKAFGMFSPFNNNYFGNQESSKESAREERASERSRRTKR